MTSTTKPSVKRWFDRLRSRTAAFSHDLLMVPMAWMLAYWMRFNLQQIPPPYLNNALNTLPLVMLVCAVVYWSFGLYRGVWRFASLPDLVRITKAVVAATVAVMLVLFVYNRGDNVPRSVPLLFMLFQLALLSGPRLFYRWLKDHRLALRSGERVLIVGARGAGETLAREMRRDRARIYDPVAFVDDTPRRQGGDIHGIPIKGSTENIPRLVEDLAIDLIMLAVPTASAPEMQRLVELCERTGKPFRTVPQLQSLLSGQVTINQLRPVSIEDLLGRTPVTLDWHALRAGLANRVVLVTGAGGSIGSELCRQVVAAGPRRLVMLDNTEFNLYRLETEFAENHPRLDFSRYLLDVGDRMGVDALFKQERPQIVFHAAAYKHVPLLENQVRAAVRNNVFGTGVVRVGFHDRSLDALQSPEHVRHRCVGENGIVPPLFGQVEALQKGVDPVFAARPRSQRQVGRFLPKPLLRLRGHGSDHVVRDLAIAEYQVFLDLLFGQLQILRESLIAHVLDRVTGVAVVHEHRCAALYRRHVVDVGAGLLEVFIAACGEREVHRAQQQR